MSFGHQCEYQSLDACIKAVTGRVDNPQEFCETLKRETEQQCQDRAGQGAQGKGQQPQERGQQRDAPRPSKQDKEAQTRHQF